jgi:hypothetical protein|uniref:Uncharacterized protein n=1 Tax=Zea mays TaxID=4577 RepID=A0A804R403_MAIZE
MHVQEYPKFPTNGTVCVCQPSQYDPGTTNLALRTWRHATQRNQLLVRSNNNRRISGSMDRESDPVPCGREGGEEQRADEPSGKRHGSQHLPSVVGHDRVEARPDIPVEHGHGHEHDDRQERVEEVDELDPFLGGLHWRRRRRAVDDPQPAASGHRVPHGPLGVMEAVGEAEEEARRGAEPHKPGRHDAVHVVAFATVGEHRRQHLEREHRAGGEVLGQLGGAPERLRHCSLQLRCLVVGTPTVSQPLLLAVAVRLSQEWLGLRRSVGDASNDGACTRRSRHGSCGSRCNDGVRRHGLLGLEINLVLGRHRGDE